MSSKRWCLSNGWKCMHDTIHCLTYWTMTWYGKIVSWNLWRLQRTMMSWSVVSHSPLHSLHRYLHENNISELPDNIFSSLISLQKLWVHAWIYNGVLYYFMQWAITSEMSFGITLVDKTTISYWALLLHWCSTWKLTTSDKDRSQLHSNIFTNWIYFG